MTYRLGNEKLYIFVIQFFLVIFMLFRSNLAATAQQPVTVQRPVATVNGSALTEMDLEESLNELMPAGMFHGGFSSEKRASYRPQAMDKMIEKELFYQEALRLGLEIDEDLVSKYIDRIITKLGGAEPYEAALEKANLTREQHRERVRRKYLIDRVIEVRVTEKAKVSENDIKIYYEENRKMFKRPETRRLTHILISVEPNVTPEERNIKREEAEKVLKRIRSGEDMSQLAGEYSDDPYRIMGGNLGLVHKGRLEPELDEKVFSLEPGRLSDVIKTRYGFHIVRVEEIKAPEQLQLEDVSDKIKNDLQSNKENQLREVLIKGLKEQARIEIYAE